VNAFYFKKIKRKEKKRKKKKTEYATIGNQRKDHCVSRRLWPIESFLYSLMITRSNQLCASFRQGV
jgi:hypothetical protein